MISLLLLGLVAAKVDYSQYRVERFNITSAGDLAVLKAFVSGKQIDAWSPLSVGLVDLRLGPDQRAPSGLLSHVLIENLQTAIEKESKKPVGRAAAEFTQSYHSIDEMYAWMDKIGSTFTVGKSYLGHDIRGVKIGPDSAKFKLVAHGGIHAREWIAPATIIHMIDALKSKEIGQFQFHLIPVANPDGYEYSRTTDRMWRKNRQPIPGSSCIGTDNNRNWGFEWRKEGLHCEEMFSGTGPFSTPETKAISEYILKVRPIAYFDMHSYGNLFMSPFAYTCSTRAKDFFHQDAAAKKAVAAIAASSGRVYKQGTICDVIYPAHGSSADWAYMTANVKYSYGIELPGDFREGFIVSPSKIPSIGEETLAGFQAVVDFIQQNE
ncbi:corticosteroid- binding protein [Entomophthora muscae]|uniref:Corticosteroid- binding protein n=1 Tax=Entomophthora muscae TaxID=34485 RepID=A0ACC2S6A4_9FUNG|nr:corticosteroid- binding protein [Entomophthora muscae]